MLPTNLLSKGLDRDICTAHERFLAAMETRLPAMNLETKERYFAILSTLVGKLEMREKDLRQVVQEMMAEGGGLYLAGDQPRLRRET